MNRFTTFNIQDAQQKALSFLIQQASHIETEVYKIAYPEIQYPVLIPVDTSASEWSKSITFFSSDKQGLAAWFAGDSKDMPRADVTREKFEAPVYMAGIGYGYNLEELGQAQMLGQNLGNDRAESARRASEEFLENLALRGDTTHNLKGLINQSSVTASNATADGTGSSALWTAKTSDLILRDVNDILTSIYSASLTVELADTLLLPVAQYTLISTKRVTDTNMTVLEFIKLHNVYTATTGQPLTIRAVRGLETAGATSTARMVAYKRDPRKLKFHLPMPHRFLPVWQTGPLQFDVPGIFRSGGLEVRLPGSMRYLDGI
jgi:hypothetical protein